MLNSVAVTTSVLLSTNVVLISRPLRVIGRTVDSTLVKVVTYVLVWVINWVAGSACGIWLLRPAMAADLPAPTPAKRPGLAPAGLFEAGIRGAWVGLMGPSLGLDPPRS